MILKKAERSACREPWRLAGFRRTPNRRFPSQAVTGPHEADLDRTPARDGVGPQQGWSRCVGTGSAKSLDPNGTSRRATACDQRS